MAGVIETSATRRGLMLAGLLLAAVVARAAEPVPLAAFFGPVEMGAVALSPDGRKLVMTVPGKNQRLELVGTDLDQQPLRWRSLAWLTDYDVANAIWLNDKRLVFEAFDSQAGEWAGRTGLWAVDADGDNGRMLIDPHWAGFRAVQPGNRNILSAEWQLHALPGDGSDDVLVSRRGWSAFSQPVTTTLARLNTHVPQPRRLSDGAPEGSSRWLTDERGQPQALEAVSGGKRRIYRRDETAGWRELAAFDEDALGGWTPRFVRGGVLFGSSEPEGATGEQLGQWDEEGRTLRPVLAAKGFDVGRSAVPLVDQPSGKLLGWRYRLDTVYTRWADPGLVALQAAIDRALPGRANLLQCSACLDSPRLLVQSLSDREPARYFLLERASGKLTSLGSAHPDVPAGVSGGRSLQRIRARDGAELPVYLTRPAPGTASTGPLPVVVYVHGGPQSRVTLEWGADPVPQFLASRGYLVIEPEFRGSAGYGLAHEKGGWRQWGLASQDDLHDALQWAVAQGLADRSRACIMGASYGGYAALMGPVRHPGDYRCAIAWVAPTDLPLLVDDWSRLVGGDKTELRRVRERVGSADALHETSPLNRTAALAQAGVPLLAAWGVDDRRVSIEHGRRFRDALQRAGVTLEYVEYPGEGHVWMNPKTSIDFFGRAERLLARSLAEKPAAQP